MPAHASHNSARWIVHWGVDGVLYDPAEHLLDRPFTGSTIRFFPGSMTMNETDLRAQSVASQSARWCMVVKNPTEHVRVD